MSAAEKETVLSKVTSSPLPKRRECWQPAKMGQSETREIKGLIEV